MGHILIVDDDAQLRQSFEKLLHAEGHTVKTASSGETAIALVKAEVPDLVIMDIRMPGMSGLEAFRAIHEMEPKLPVIIMTAFGTTETAIEATKLGAFEYVLKPFERYPGHPGHDLPGPGGGAVHAFPGGTGRGPGYGRGGCHHRQKQAHAGGV